MEPSLKAKELVDKLKPHMFCYMGSGMLTNEYDEVVATNHAKLCALILVDEIVATDMLLDEYTYVNTVSYLGFWEEVKKGIALLSPTGAIATEPQ